MNWNTWDLARGRWRLRIPYHAAHYTQMVGSSPGARARRILSKSARHSAWRAQRLEAGLWAISWADAKKTQRARGNRNKRNGRHEETRTPDLYRVNRSDISTLSNLQRPVDTAKPS
jgi:hypothetical protein